MTMLNTTYVLRHLERKLGFKFNELEIDSEEIMDTLREETLVTFSKFFPYQVNSEISDATKLETASNEYYINTDFQILNVARVYDNTTMYAGGGLLPYTGNMMDPMSRQFTADAMSMNKNPLVYEFFHPNILKISPALYVMRETKILLNCVHPDHFATIPTNLQSEFLKLALYDIKETLFQIRRRFANLQTAYGNIELFIDDLQEATQLKTDMLAEWRRHAGKQANRKKLYIY
jgi:hypothetical protein